MAGLAGVGCAGLAGWLRRAAQPLAAPEAEAPAAELPAGTWRAVWVSYLEWAEMDFSSAEAFRAEAVRLAENCRALGLNTILAQVRPFGDALYRSTLYPWSHLCTGEQGRDPGFDPLDILLAEAHSRGISVEAWINPYRLRSSAALPRQLAAENLLYTRPEWVWTDPATGAAALNPSCPEAAAYVVQGVEELVRNYPVDGIHFDDYFYPTTAPELDAERFAASGAADLGAWRRDNVTAMVRAVYRAVKQTDPTLRFGISPQGNPDNNYAGQYSDIFAWLTAEGDEAVADYLCPQIYWGYGYTTSTGSTRFAFENIVAEWLAMPRAVGVALWFGLGAYRVGAGDGGADPDSVSRWCTGSALAEQAADLKARGVGGLAFYRYASLFATTDLAQQERAALAAFHTME